MTILIPKPLSAEAFERFGDVFSTTAPGLHWRERSLTRQREGAGVSLATRQIAPVIGSTLVIREMERHPCSSQSFIHLTGGRWLVVVCPQGDDGGPDVSQAEAFIGEAEQGITYAANVWHHNMCALDEDTSFAVLMWRAGDASDEEFREVSAFKVALAR